MNDQLPSKIIDALSELSHAQLLQLNKIIVEKIDLFNKVKCLKALNEFNIGDRITFNYEDKTFFGKVLKLNQKTISIRTEDGRRWNVSPQFLSKLNSAC